MGHIVDADSVRVNPVKTAAIREAPPPKDIQALESLLGLAQYYADIVPGFATLVNPLNKLRRSGVEWEWTPVRQVAFYHLKNPWQRICFERTLST